MTGRINALAIKQNKTIISYAITIGTSSFDISQMELIKIAKKAGITTSSDLFSDLDGREVTYTTSTLTKLNVSAVGEQPVG